MGMVVRTNTMALNAYRQLGMNNNAVSKSLEKLSSGFRINRAADDAAGLAISEKMKAQIKGLETASSNAQDGISLLQTAEGNLSEVHNMLNRMVELATKSANGTYTITEREALQDEVDQLLEEIDRISQSANFNGARLLDGSLAKGGGGKTYAGMDRIIKDVLGSGEDAIANTGVKTILDGTGKTTAEKTVFDVDFTGLTAKDVSGVNAGKKAKYSFDLSGVAATSAGLNTKVIDGQALTFTTDLNGTMAKFLTDYNGDDTKAYTASWDATAKKVTLTAKEAGAKTAPTTDLTGTTTVDATEDVWTATATLGGAFVAGDSFKNAAGDTITVVADTATPTTGQMKVTDANALGIDDLTITFANATAVTDYTITGDGTKEVVFTADKAGAVGTSGPGTAPVIGDLGAITTNITGGNKTVTWNLVHTTTGAEASTTPGATLTAHEDVAGEDGDAGATAPAIKINSFKVGGKELLGTAKAVDIDADATATDIANAIAEKLGTDEIEFDNGAKYTVEAANGKLTFTMTNEPTKDNIAANFDWDVSITGGKFEGNHTAGTVVTTPGVVSGANDVANTVFRIEAGDIKDGTVIKLDGSEVVLKVGQNGTATGGTVIDLTRFEEGKITDADLNDILSEISKGFNGATDHFIVGTNNTANGDTHKGLTVHRKDDSAEKYTTIEKLAEKFELVTPGKGSALTLQIGDTAENFNKMSVSIDDMSAAGLKINDIDITTEANASDAIARIKTAINTVSSARAGMGALQNRLEYTINNLDVAVENLSAANSRIRDTDMAKEMMNYTKMNVLVQSAQAMLAQANQQPQSVLQLLQ